VFLVNSRFASFVEGCLATARPYPEVTAVVLPSSYTRVLSYTLAHLRPPTCVGLRYGCLQVDSRSFSRCPILSPGPTCVRLAIATRLMLGGFSYPTPLRAQRIIPGSSGDARTRHSIETYRQRRNINLLSIDYAFRPRLRTG